MGRKGKRPRNKLGQYASYDPPSAPVAGGSSSGSGNHWIPVVVGDSDSDDLQQQMVVVSKPSKEGGRVEKGKSPRSEDSSDGMEISSETSDDVAGLIDEVDEVFVEAKKKMCDDGAADPEKIDKGLDWLYQGILSPWLCLKRMNRAKEGGSKKYASK